MPSRKRPHTPTRPAAPSAQPRPRRSYRPLAFAAIILIATTLAYAHTFHAPFQCDDRAAIVENPTIRSLWPLGRVLSPAGWGATTHARPMLNLSLALNYHVGQLNVFGYHVVNLLIHLAAAALLFALSRRLLRLPSTPPAFREPADALAFTITLLWALHPLNTQAVTYVAQRVEAMMAVFYLLTLYCLVRSAEHRTQNAELQRRAWSCAALTACALGMATKEVMLSAPIMAALLDRCFLATSWREVLHRRGWLHAGLALTWSVLIFLIITQGGYRADETGFGSVVSPWHYLLTESGVILHYIRLAAWPHPLSFDYSDLPLIRHVAEAWPQLLAVGALVALTFAGLRFRPRIAWIALTFFAVLAPTSSFMPILDVMQERRMYLPLMTLISLFVLALHHTLRSATRHHRLAFCLLTSALCLLLGTLTHRRNHAYRSEYALWMDVLAKRPQNAQAAVTAGATLLDAGRLDDAMALFNRAIGTTARSGMAFNNRGLAYLRRGDYLQAIEDFSRALELPGMPRFKVQNNRGIAHAALNNTAAAMQDYSAAIHAMPMYATAYHNRARLHAAMGDPASAFSDFERAQRYAPEQPDTYLDRGNLLATLNRHAEAIDDFSRALHVAPENADACYNRANSLSQLERFPEALHDYNRAIQLRPDKAEAYNNRASVNLILGDPASARQDLLTCARLGLTPNSNLVEMVESALAP